MRNADFWQKRFNPNVFRVSAIEQSSFPSFCTQFKHMCFLPPNSAITLLHARTRFSLVDKLNALQFNNFICDSNHVCASRMSVRGVCTLGRLHYDTNETEVLYLKHLSSPLSNAAATDTSSHRDCVNIRSHVSIYSYQQSSHIQLEHTRFGSPKKSDSLVRAREQRTKNNFRAKKNRRR